MYNRSAQQVVYSVNGKREWGGGMTRGKLAMCRKSFFQWERERVNICNVLWTQQRRPWKLLRLRRRCWSKSSSSSTSVVISRVVSAPLPVTDVEESSCRLQWEDSPSRCRPSPPPRDSGRAKTASIHLWEKSRLEWCWPPVSPTGAGATVSDGTNPTSPSSVSCPLPSRFHGNP